MDIERSRALVVAACALLATACSSSSPSAPAASGDDTTPSLGPAGATAPPAAPGPAAAPVEDPPEPPGPPLDPNVDPATRSNPEELFVLMQDFDGGTWFCTGTLIAKDVVLTAGHCVDTSKFGTHEVLAPTIASHPRVKASRVAIYDWNWDDVEHPDLGILVLEQPIELGQYAALTDVSARVDAAEPLSVGAIVRTAENPEAPLHEVGPLPLSSSTADGYPHSYAVPMFSAGGDSGAGIFLVENGKPTHKLVAVEHTPDPARGADHVSRIDAAFIKWVADNSAGR